MNAEQREYLPTSTAQGATCCRSSTTCSTSRRSKPAGSSTAREPLDLRMPAREATELIRSLAIKKNLTLQLKAPQR